MRLEVPVPSEGRKSGQQPLNEKLLQLIEFWTALRQPISLWQVAVTSATETTTTNKLTIKAKAPPTWPFAVCWVTQPPRALYKCADDLRERIQYRWSAYTVRANFPQRSLNRPSTVSISHRGSSVVYVSSFSTLLFCRCSDWQFTQWGPIEELFCLNPHGSSSTLGNL